MYSNSRLISFYGLGGRKLRSRGQNAREKFFRFSVQAQQTGVTGLPRRGCGRRCFETAERLVSVVLLSVSPPRNRREPRNPSSPSSAPTFPRPCIYFLSARCVLWKSSFGRSHIDANCCDSHCRNFTELPTGWSFSNVSNACDWKATPVSSIYCDANGRISQILLESFNLNTTIPLALAQMSSLSALVLADGELYGTIPPQLFSLPLNFLRLSTNELTGPLPVEVLNCTNLQNLQIESNLLTGTIPAGIENLPLVEISIYKNRFSCPFPFALYNKMTAIQSNFCLLNANSWDSAENGRICNSTLFETSHATACAVAPFPASTNGRVGGYDFTIDAQAYQIAVRGGELMVFGRDSKGQPYRGEYVSLRIYSLSFYEQVGPRVLFKNPSVRQFYSVPLVKLTNFTQISPGVWELSAYFTNAPVHTFTYTLHTDYAGLAGFVSRSIHPPHS